MARKPKLKKFTPPKASPEALELRAQLAAAEPERKKMHDEFYRDAEAYRKSIGGGLTQANYQEVGHHV